MPKCIKLLFFWFDNNAVPLAKLQFMDLVSPSLNWSLYWLVFSEILLKMFNLMFCTMLVFFLLGLAGLFLLGLSGLNWYFSAGLIWSQLAFFSGLIWSLLVSFSSGLIWSCFYLLILLLNLFSVYGRSTGIFIGWSFSGIVHHISGLNIESEWGIVVINRPPTLVMTNKFHL